MTRAIVGRPKSLRMSRASLQTETNIYSPVRTGDGDFADVWYPAGEHPTAPTLYPGPRARDASVDSPGVATLDLESLPFEHADRRVWPLGPVEEKRRVP